MDDSRDVNNDVITITHPIACNATTVSEESSQKLQSASSFNAPMMATTTSPRSTRQRPNTSASCPSTPAKQQQHRSPNICTVVSTDDVLRYMNDHAENNQLAMTVPSTAFVSNRDSVAAATCALDNEVLLTESVESSSTIVTYDRADDFDALAFAKKQHELIVKCTNFERQANDTIARLETENEELRRRNVELQSAHERDVAAWKSRIEQMDNSLQRTNTMLAQKNERIESLGQVLTETNEKLEQMESDLQKLHEDKAAGEQFLQQELESHETEVQNYRKVIDELNEKLTEWDCCQRQVLQLPEVQDATTSIDDRIQPIDFEKNNAAMTAELADAVRMVHDLSENYGYLATYLSEGFGLFCDRVALANQNLESVRTNHLQTQTLNQKLANEKDTLLSQLADAALENASLKADLEQQRVRALRRDELEKRIKQMTSELNEHKDEVKRLKREQVSRVDENTKFRLELAQQNDELAYYKSRTTHADATSKFAAERDALIAENEALHDQIRDLKKTVKDGEDVCFETERERKELTAVVQKLREAKADIETKYDDLGREHDALEDNMKLETQQWQAKCDLLTKQKNELETQLASLTTLQQQQQITSATTVRPVSEDDTDSAIDPSPPSSCSRSIQTTSISDKRVQLLLNTFGKEISGDQSAAVDLLQRFDQFLRSVLGQSGMDQHATQAHITKLVSDLNAFVSRQKSSLPPSPRQQRLERDLKAKIEENKRLREQLSKMRDQLRTAVAENHNESLRTDLESARRSLQDQNAEISNQRDRLQIVEEQLEQMRYENRKLNTKLQEAGGKLESFLSNDAQINQPLLISAEETIKTMTEEYQNVLARCERLDEQNRTLFKHGEQLRRRNDDLQTALTQQRHTTGNERLQQQVQVLKTNYNRTRNELKQVYKFVHEISDPKVRAEMQAVVDQAKQTASAARASARQTPTDHNKSARSASTPVKHQQQQPTGSALSNLVIADDNRNETTALFFGGKENHAPSTIAPSYRPRGAPQSVVDSSIDLDMTPTREH